MVTGSWLDNDNKFRQYGTSKAVPSTAGDFLQYGSTRMIEVFIDLTKLTTSPLAQDYVTFFPTGTQTFIEQVEVVTEVGAVGGTSFSVGLGYMTPGTLTNPPAITAISNTAFVAAMITADVTTAGQKTTLNEGSTYAGAYIGSQSTSTTQKNYITALAAGTFSAGQVKVRIFYRGIGTITQ